MHTHHYSTQLPNFPKEFWRAAIERGNHQIGFPPFLWVEVRLQYFCNWRIPLLLAKGEKKLGFYLHKETVEMINYVIYFRIFCFLKEIFSVKIKPSWQVHSFNSISDFCFFFLKKKDVFFSLVKILDLPHVFIVYTLAERSHIKDCK